MKFLQGNRLSGKPTFANSIFKISVGFCLAFILVVLAKSANLAHPTHPAAIVTQAQDGEDETAAERIEALEQRVDRLEQLLFNTVRLNVFDAERQLNQAEHQLKTSHKLFLRGFISDQRLQQDQFEVNRAQRELKLAKSVNDGRRMATQIEVMDAKQNLFRAKDRLRQTENLNRRGFTTLTEVQRQEQLVEVFDQQLKLAENRLDAITEIIESQDTKQIESDDSQPATDDQPEDNKPQDEQSQDEQSQDKQSEDDR